VTILGVALIAIGLIANLPILKTIGIVLAAIGVLLWLLGRFGHGVNHLVPGARARDCGVAVPVFADGVPRPAGAPRCGWRPPPRTPATA